MNQKKSNQKNTHRQIISNQCNYEQQQHINVINVERD